MSNVVWSVILPAFNEEATIENAVFETRRVLQEIGSPSEIIVVDDGSMVPIKNDFSGVKVIRHEQNQGKGAAVRTGVLAARGEYICFLDCDLSTHPNEIKKAIPFLQIYDLVIGSRVMQDSRITQRQPWLRIVSGKIFNRFIQRYLNIPFRDTQCGFKIFRRSVASLFNQLQTKGWAFDVELIVRVMQQGLCIQEIPVEWKNGFESRVRFRDVWKIWKELREMKKRVRLSQ